jgi:AraC family transcriptional regulator
MNRTWQEVAMRAERMEGQNDGDPSRIDEWLRLPDCAKLRVRGLDNSRLMVTEIRYDHHNYGSSDPVIHQDAFVAGLQLRPQAFHELSYDGQSIPVYGGRPGDTLFADLRAVDRVVTDVPFHSLQFFFSRAFVNAVADDLEVPRIKEVAITPGESVRDGVITRVGRKVQTALDSPHEMNELFASHCMMALGIYVCATYGNMRAGKHVAGGLSAWQERVAKDMIEAHLDGSIALDQLAATCKLSASRFAHAFRASAGVAPHRWLLKRRVERAKTLLKHSAETLTNVALSCGFADQSHFTRVFKQSVGVSPGAWRESVQ